MQDQNIRTPYFSVLAYSPVTSVQVEGGVDVEVHLSLNGERCSDEVTLMKGSVWGSWGPSVDAWMGGRMFAFLQAIECRDLRDKVRDAIESHARISIDESGKWPD